MSALQQIEDTRLALSEALQKCATGLPLVSWTWPVVR